MSLGEKTLESYIERQVREAQAIKPLEKILDKDEIPQTLRLPEKDVRWLMTESESLPSTLLDVKQDRGMYASVTKIFCKAVADWGKGKKFLDVMAGRGWLVKGLREAGLDVHGTDDLSWANKLGWSSLKGIKIEQLDAIDAIVKYGADYDVIILSWPPYENDIDYEVVEKLHEINPDALILYIGEGVGGCTGSDEFFDVVEEIEDEAFEPVYFSYETVRGLHDKPRLFKFNKQEG